VENRKCGTRYHVVTDRSSLCSLTCARLHLEHTDSVPRQRVLTGQYAAPIRLCLDIKFGSKLQFFSITLICHTHIIFQSHHLQFQPKSKLCAELNTALVLESSVLGGQDFRVMFLQSFQALVWSSKVMFL
jgi:hypothetical protein